MEEQIYAFLAGGIAGCLFLFCVLLMMGASSCDPDNW